MNGKINQSPTSDESNSTLRWCADSAKHVENGTHFECITNLWIPRVRGRRFVAKTSSRLKNSRMKWRASTGVMQAENLCRFMSPYVNDSHQGTKNFVITIPRCNFDFYARREERSNAFCAIFNFQSIRSNLLLAVKSPTGNEKILLGRRAWCPTDALN